MLEVTFKMSLKLSFRSESTMINFFSEEHRTSFEQSLEDEIFENEQEFEALKSLINILMRHACQISGRRMKLTGSCMNEGDVCKRPLMTCVRIYHLLVYFVFHHKINSCLLPQ